MRTVVLAGVRVSCVLMAAQSASYVPGLIFMSNLLTKPHPNLNRVVIVVSNFVVPVVLAVFSRAIANWIVPAPSDLRGRFPPIEQFTRVAIRASLVVVATIVTRRFSGMMMGFWRQSVVGQTPEWELALEGFARTSLELVLLPLLAFAVERRIVPWILAGCPRGVTCPKCGYDIQGLTIGKCPECGSANDAPLTSAP